jgi:hypothetical protein
MWLALLLAVAAVFFLGLKKQGAPSRVKVNNNSRRQGLAKKLKTSELTQSVVNQYRAISICCEEHACGVAVAAQGKRHLVNQTPSLPLEGCDAEQCQCRYEHHDDRRDEESDRRLNFGLNQDLHGAANSERRERKDRRKIKF